MSTKERTPGQPSSTTPVLPWLPPVTCIVTIGILAGFLVFGAETSESRSQPDLATQAKTALGDRRFADAESALRKLLGQSLSDAEARVLLGRVLLESSRPREAKEEFLEALKANPGHYEGVRGLAESLERTGQSGPALTAYERAAMLRQNDPRPWRELGLAAERAGDDARALDALRRSLALAPEQPDLAAMVARIESRAADWEAGGVATMKPRPIHPEDFLPKSPVPDPADWLPKPEGRRK